MSTIPRAHSWPPSQQDSRVSTSTDIPVVNSSPGFRSPKLQDFTLHSVRLLCFPSIPSECTYEREKKTKTFSMLELTAGNSLGFQVHPVFRNLQWWVVFVLFQALPHDSGVLAQSWRLSLCACLSFALKAYFVSCNCSIISLASFISAASRLYFSTSSWFSLRSSTTSWLSSSLCFPQCSFSCSISDSVSSMCFTRLSSLSFDISEMLKLHWMAGVLLSVRLLSCLEWLLRSWRVWDGRYSFSPLIPLVELSWEPSNAH